MRILLSAVLATVVLGLAGTAHAQFGGLGGGMTCGDDKGVGVLFKQMNEMFFNSYLAAEECRANALEATGNKADAEKIRSQTKDLKADKGPKDAQKAAAESVAGTQKALDDFDKSAKVLDDAGKALIGQARKSATKANLFITVASLIAVPIALQATQAISGNKVCATSLLPAINAGKNLVATAKNVDAGNKAIGGFAKKQGLPDMTAAETKSLVQDMKLSPELQKGLPI